MKREILFFAALSIIILLFLSACHKNPVEPPFNIRNLTWTIDTLAHPDNWQTGLCDIWGSSINNVYMVGIANTTRGILWRYTLDQWIDIKISATQGGPITGPISFSDVFGFGKNDVWVCGDRLITNQNPQTNLDHTKLLIHWDGVKWKEVATPEGNNLTAIWGSSPDNIWFGGTYGTLFHYDGIDVKKDTIPLNIIKDTSYPQIVISITGNEYESYMLFRSDNPTPRYYLLKYENNKWTVKDSSFYYNSEKLWMSPSGILYTAGASLYQLQSDTWERVLDGNTTLWSFGIHGTGDNNVFIVGQSIKNTGAVYHYNGHDWFSYKELEFPGVIYYDVWTDGKEVFVTGITGSKTIVLHGK